MIKRTLYSLAALAALSGCAIVIAPNDDVSVHTLWSDSGVQGNGSIAVERRAASAVTALEVQGPLSVEVRVGQAPSLEVEGDSNLLPMIRTEGGGNTMRIWLDGNVRTSSALKVRYTVPKLEQVYANGSGRLIVTDLNGAHFSFSSTGSRSTELMGNVARLDVQVNGSGSLNATALSAQGANVSLNGSGRVTIGNINGEVLTARVNGSGGLQASGNVQKLNADVYGSGGVNLSGLTAQMADLSTHGSGDISANVRQSVVAQSNGSGRITVYGNPAQRTVTGKRVSVL